MRTALLLAPLALLATPAAASAQEAVGGPVSEGRAILVDIAMNGATPWVAYADEASMGQIHVKRFDGSAWVEVGPVPSPAHAASHLDLQFEQNVPYVLFSAADGYTLITWDGAEWSRVGATNFGADLSTMDPTLAFTNNVPHVVYQDMRKQRPDAYAHYELDKIHIWGMVDAIGLLPDGSEQPAAVSDIGDDLYFAHHERGASKLVVNKAVSDVEKLEPVGAPYKSKHIANFLGMRADGRQLYLAYEDNSNAYQPTVLKLDDKRKKWKALPGLPADAGVGTKELQWTEKLAFAWLVDDSKVMTARFDGTAWTKPVQIGAGTEMGIGIASNLDTTYVAYVDTANGNRVAVKVIEPDE